MVQTRTGEEGGNPETGWGETAIGNTDGDRPGGTVTATGGDRAPGIGSGMNSGAGSANSSIINGVTVTGNGAATVVGSRGNGEGTNGTDGVKTKNLADFGSNGATGTATSGKNTRCAIGEGDY